MKHFLFSLLCLVFLASAKAQKSDPPLDNLMPRELIFKDKDKNRITLSKDGETIFYQKKADGSDSTLYFISGKSPLA
ncbi:MAG: hypothetical protein AAB316_07030, partial [Bacteroidota bacterium]